MFKQLILILVLVLAVAVGGTIAAELNDECTMEPGSMIILKQGPRGIGVTTNRAMKILVGKEITKDQAKLYKEYSIKQGADLDWDGAHYVAIEDGNMAIVREDNLKECGPAEMPESDEPNILEEG